MKTIRNGIVGVGWVLALVPLACTAAEPPPEPVTPAPAVPASAPPAETSAASAPDAGGAPCTTNGDCGEGEMCAGLEGCDAAWTCVPARACTRDYVTFCGCDGKTFTSSSSCPSAPYRHVGSCF